MISSRATHPLNSQMLRLHKSISKGCIFSLLANGVVNYATYTHTTRTNKPVSCASRKGSSEPAWNENNIATKINDIIRQPRPLTTIPKSSRSPLRASTTLPKEFIFHDADHYIAAEAVLNNQIRFIKQELNTIRGTLLVSGQMFGSGKTYFGNYWAAAIRHTPEILNQLCKKNSNIKYYAAPELVDKVPKTITVSVNFLYEYRQEGQTLHEYVTSGILRNLIKTLKTVNDPNYWFPLSVPKEVKSFDLNCYLDELEGLGSVTLRQLFEQTHSHINLPFVVHFDEIDKLPVVFNIDSTSIEAVALFYYLVDFLRAPMAETGTTFYCSGRSTLLFGLGTGAYHSYELYSRELKVVPLTFGPFTHKEISVLLGKAGLQFNSDASKDAWASYILQKTCGMRRLCTYTIKYIIDIFRTTKLDATQITNFLDSRNILEKYDCEIEFQFPKDEVFKRMAFLAALSVPVDPTMKVNPQDFGIPSNTFMLLSEVIRCYNFYTVQSDRYLYLIVPPLILEYLSQNKDVKYKALIDCMVPFSELDSDYQGVMLERIAQKTLMYQLKDKKATAWSNYFPFLKGSYIGDCHVNIQGILAWPTMVSTHTHPLSQLTIKERTIKEHAIKEFFSKSVGSIEVNTADWPFLLVQYQKKSQAALCVSHPASHSSDAFHIIGQFSLHWQFKHTKITLSMMTTELNKIRKIGTTKVTLVIISFDLDATILDHTSAKVIKNQDKSVDLALYFTGESLKQKIALDTKVTPETFNAKALDAEVLDAKATSEDKSTFTSFENTEVIVLLPNGIDMLLSPVFASLLHQKSTDFLDYYIRLSKV